MFFIAQYCQIDDVSFSMSRQLGMFESVCNDPMFIHRDVLVLLNKSDILEKRFGFGSITIAVSDLKTLPFIKHLNKNDDEYLSKDDVVGHIKKMFNDVRKENEGNIHFHLMSVIDECCMNTMWTMLHA